MATCVSVLHLKSIIALNVLLRVFAEADGISIIHRGLSDKIPQRKPSPRLAGSWYVLLTSGYGSWIRAREWTGMEVLSDFPWSLELINLEHLGWKSELPGPRPLSGLERVRQRLVLLGLCT